MGCMGGCESMGGCEGMGVWGAWMGVRAWVCGGHGWV